MADDTLVLTGPVLQQIAADKLLVTPTGGAQGNLADFINGGTVAQRLVGTFVDHSVAVGITAAGTAFAGAVALTAAIDVLASAATGSGVVLPPISVVGVGGSVDLFNNGAGTVSVYGAAGNTIDTIAGTTGVLLGNAKRCEYIATSGSTYVSALLGAVSA